MSETLRLLKFDPAVALLIMANNHLNVRLHSTYVDFGLPVAIDEDGLTDVLISTKPSVDRGVRRDHIGQILYRYQRIHVADIFSDAVLDLTPPLTVHSVVRNIATATGLAIGEDDFVNALIEEQKFVLKANEHSLRWYGEVEVVLNEPGVTIQLADAFPNNVLDGLYVPDYSGPVELARAFPNNNLNGLIAPFE